MKVIALTGRAGSGKDTAALGIRMLTGSLDPTWLMSIEGCPVSGPERHVVDLKEFFDIKWPNFPSNPDNEWKVFKFAYPIYQIVATLVGRDIDDIMDDPTFKTQYQAWGLTGRQLLQKVGTECFRDTISKEVWLDVMNRSLIALQATGMAGVIISDLRFLNEAQFLTDVWDAHILKLTDRLDSKVTSGHQSETELESITADFQISNGSTFGILMDQLATVCEAMDILNCKYTWK